MFAVHNYKFALLTLGLRMSKRPKISIIVPTYNSAGTINNCIDSIISQDYGDYELVVADGNSKDGTVAIIEARNTLTEKLTLICEPDAGIYDAMNKAIKRSRGEWLLFLGSDDRLCDPAVLSDLNRHLNAGADFVYGNVFYQLGDGPAKIYDGEFTERKLAVRNICHQAIFYRASLFERFGLYDTRYVIFADYAFNFRAFPRSKARFVDRVIAVCDPDGASSRVQDVHFKEDLVSLTFFNTPIILSPLYRYRLRELSRLFFRLLSKGDIRKAIHAAIILVSNSAVRFCYPASRVR
jgi:glycosyltransferase involved in cell wall biosynthesis